MITKSEFSNAAFASIGEYPTLEILYQAKDPRLFQHIDAIAMMLSMFSAQLEVAQAEPFEKTRNSTVLADAAMRGIIPKAKPAILNVQVVNESNATLEIATNRILLDSSGRYLRVDSAVRINIGQTGIMPATQLYKIETKHTVTESRAFYEIPISMKHEESFLCGIRVFDQNGNEYAYTDRYAAGKANEKIFHIEVDEKQNFYIRFGYKGIVGVQPARSDEFTIQAFYTFGRIDNYSIGDQIAFEVNQSVNDSYAKLSIAEVTNSGDSPISMAVLRELSKYPSVYNKNAVYLGDFDFLIRSNFPNLAFLSVWGEAAEELARKPDIKNINCLFIAVVGNAGQEDYDQYIENKVPSEVTQLTELQKSIMRLVAQADDGYRVRFIQPVVREIGINITATVSTSYDAFVIKQQIKEVTIEAYGQAAVAMRRGKARPLYQDLYRLIKSKVPALTIGSADLVISMEDLSPFDAFPEIWHFVDNSKLNITVANSNVSTSSWGVGF